MPRYVRWRDRGATYFFTLVTHQRRPLFRDAIARRLLNRSMVGVRKRYPFDMTACVLLPDHLHCVWSLPENDDDFPLRWRQIKASFTHAYLECGGASGAVTTQRAAKRGRGVWQARYWEHRIRDEDDWLRHRDYIHWNPVKHGYVANPGDWPWSSFRRYVRLGWLDANWPGASGVELADVPGE